MYAVAWLTWQGVHEKTSPTESMRKYPDAGAGTEVYTQGWLIKGSGVGERRARIGN